MISKINLISALIAEIWLY